ncbi:hypothetical protein M5D96_004982 [Drosophila gunungcola]|uniref:Uncharacterized protein n=1 Tax=Drosophila gunungcola TaxID=103775 RepID=A0A9P9YVX3_9MUSC|nr:hypothetical protein M5D96_004982 [Drosophila gunungcola]
MWKTHSENDSAFEPFQLLSIRQSISTRAFRAGGSSSPLWMGSAGWTCCSTRGPSARPVIRLWPGLGLPDIAASFLQPFHKWPSSSALPRFRYS